MSAIENPVISAAKTGEQGLRSFVLLPLEQSRFALPAESVVELVAPVRLAGFPHRTPWITGVIVRRGRIVPVCNTSALFDELFPQNAKRQTESFAQGRFLLIAEWRLGGLRDWCAIPVSGECELASPDAAIEPAPEGAHPDYITGELNANGERIGILDLGRVIERHLILPRAEVDTTMIPKVPSETDVPTRGPAS